MKKKLSYFIAIVALTLIITNSFAFAIVGDKGISNVANESKLEKLININVGTGENEIVYSQEIEGIANDGPTSFAIDSNNNFFILDTLGKKVLVFKEYKWDSNIDISFCGYARDIVTDDQSIYILDESNVIFKIDNKGNILDTYRLPPNIYAYDVKKLFFSDKNKIAIDTGNSEYVFEDNIVLKQIDKKIILKKTDTEIEIHKNDKKFSTIPFVELSGGGNIINGYSNQNILVEVIDEVPNSPLVIVEDTLRMIDSNGKQIGFFRVPLEEYYNFPLRFCNVGVDGNIYIMAMKKNALEIDRVVLGKKYISKMNELKMRGDQEKQNLEINEKNDNLAKLASDPGLPTRSEVQARADAIINLSWSYTIANKNNPNSAKVTMPPYLSSITQLPSSLNGIPYCWGGFDAIDRVSSSSNGTSFKDAISKSKFAGNTNTTASSSWTSGTAGLDCSGFASAVYSYLSHKSTSNFAVAGVSASSPLNMDYYVKSGSHILLFSSYKDSTTIYSKEATTTGSPQTTKVYTRTLTYLSTNGYVLRTLWQ